MQFNKKNANTPYSSGVVSYTNTQLENVNLTAVLPTRTNKGPELQTEHEPKTFCAEKSYFAVEFIKKYAMHMRQEITLLCKILWVRALNSHL